MLKSTRSRYVASFAVWMSVAAGTFVESIFLVFALTIFALIGVTALALWTYDWCRQGDEDLEAVRAEVDRRHARV